MCGYRHYPKIPSCNTTARKGSVLLQTYSYHPLFGQIKAGPPTITFIARMEMCACIKCALFRLVRSSIERGLICKRGQTVEGIFSHSAMERIVRILTMAN